MTYSTGAGRQQTMDGKTCGTALVSVVIPVHNRFHLAQVAINSVLEQSHRPVEVIIVDDGSTPEFTPQVAELPPGVSLCTIRHDSSVGPGGARESGRKKAQGEFIAYLDSDDYWSPDFLAALVKTLEANPHAGMAYSTAISVSNGRRSGVVKRSNLRYEQILPTILWGRPWHTSGCVWRRSITDRIGEWLPLWRWEDYEYDCRAGCLNIRLEHVEEPLCFIGLSETGHISIEALERRGVTSFGAAIAGIVESIGRSDWASDSRIRSRLSYLSLRAAKEANQVRLLRSGLRCLFIGWRLSGARALLVVPTLMTCLFLLSQKKSLAARMINRMQRKVVAHPVNS